MTKLTVVPAELTKQAIADASTRFVSALVDGGEEDLLSAFIKLKALKGAVDAAVKELTGDAMNVADMYADGERVLHGVKFQVKGGTEKYDFSHDAIWKAFKDEEDEAANARKKREGFLKSLEKRMVDPETGEYISPAILTGYNASSLAITFPKE